MRLVRLLLTDLKRAANAHDARGGCCGDAVPRCVRCARLRAGGKLCGLPGCGVRQPQGADAPRPLKRCAACATFAYCGAEHQRAHWPAHKPECRALAAARGR
jgi:hypothetical protein